MPTVTVFQLKAAAAALLTATIHQRCIIPDPWNATIVLILATMIATVLLTTVTQTVFKVGNGVEDCGTSVTISYEQP